MVDIYWKINRILKEKRNLVNFVAVGVLVTFLVFNLAKQSSTNESEKKLGVLVDFKVAELNYQEKKSYSEWPELNLARLENDLASGLIVNDVCLNKQMKINIENFDLVIQKWNESSDPVCIQLHDMLKFIYDVRVHKAKMNMSDKLALKVKEWLGNDESLLKQTTSQVRFKF